MACRTICAGQLHICDEGWTLLRSKAGDDALVLAEEAQQVKL